MERGRVLIVEDDPYWQQLISETLEGEYELVIASTYEEARRALDEGKSNAKPFHVATVDMKLSEAKSGLTVRDGNRIIDQIHRMHLATQCIVVTGLPDISTTDVRDFFKQYGVYDFVDKGNFDLKEFSRIVAEAVKEARSRFSPADTSQRPRVGRYEVIEEVGRGAMGIVYRARDPNIGRMVALKVLRPELSADPKFRDLFNREARAAGRLTHPNIVTVYDAAQDGDTVFLVMEFLEGITLETLLSREGALPIQRAVDICLQVCDALDYAHQCGIVHRDIKPSNIMLVSLMGREVVKLTDFGIAKALRSTMRDTNRTHSGLVGTADYMSPEQSRDAPIDHRSDLYSLGVVLYEMLTGHVPFHDVRNPVAVILNHLFEPWPIPPDIPPPIGRVLLRASAKDPELRYQSAREMAMGLELCLDDLPHVQLGNAGWNLDTTSW